MTAAAALDDALKERIQTAYRTWLESRGFRSRRGQREMIASIARVLTRGSGERRIAAIEAGTGTGKTAAYCLAAIPIAQALDKRLVVATATVALQEQIVLRDLPDLAARTGLEFSYTLAKGRQRYVCLKRLDDQLRADAQDALPMFEASSDDARMTYQQMLHAFARGEWDGDVDGWAAGVDEAHWRGVTTDHRGCTNQRCGFFRQCPFFKARANLDKSDIVVANLDLVLADLSLGGGAVLSDPADTIYVLDEAHHLPEKTQQHFTFRLRLRATLQWLEQVNAHVGTLAQRVGRPAELMVPIQAIAALTEPLGGALRELIGFVARLEFTARDDDRHLFRFANGAVPGEFAELAAAATRDMDRLAAQVDSIHDVLQSVVDGERSWENAHEAEDWLGPIGGHVNRALGAAALLADYADRETDEPRARWITRVLFDNGDDFDVVSAPLQPGSLLEAALWSQAYAVICTSATLTALGRFDRFLERTGLVEHALALRIPSPFDYPRIATLEVPAMSADPRDANAHTDEVVRRLPELLALECSALVLFASWRQLNDVVRRLPTALTEQLKVQGNGSKQALLAAHREAIDAGHPSYVVGVASFSEGVDLPDDYCRHVIIVKLPFAVPDDPLDQAMAEWIEAQGRNAFYEISLPDAAMRLAQACGRLIRHEGDHGRITLLDRRIVTQRYGARLLDALPPFRRIT
ncbi:MAG TPA: ATP-dependent DNA helicase DinG [Pseudomonadales bacterium]|nr:ATP-dependent DNA helicase DinG [Pseudomonadales bacterium]